MAVKKTNPPKGRQPEHLRLYHIRKAQEKADRLAANKPKHNDEKIMTEDEIEEYMTNCINKINDTDQVAFKISAISTLMEIKVKRARIAKMKFDMNQGKEESDKEELDMEGLENFAKKIDQSEPSGD